MVVSAWSASIALILKEIESLAAVLNGLQLPLTLLSGVLLPLSAGPEWIRIVAHINPLYYAVEASRQLASGVFYSMEVFTAFAIMISLTVLVLTWATNVYRKAIS
jgi:ABC-2 type transport system permease protein